MDELYADYLEVESRLAHRFRGHDTRDWTEWAAFATTAAADVPRDAERAWVTRERASHAGIRECRSLRHLVAGAVDQAFLDEICQLTHLERLELEYPVTASTLAGLRSLTRLRHLSIDSPRNVTDFTPLLDLPELRTLLITNAKHLVDLDWLAGADHLEVLGIEGGMWTAQRIPTLAPLAGLTGLRAFFAVSSRLGDQSLAPLAECPRLELLSCARMAPRAEFERLRARKPDWSAPGSARKPGGEHSPGGALLRTPTMDTSPTAPPPRSSRLLGALAGLLAGAAALALSEAVSALLTGVTSPLLAVGNRAVDQAPRPLKEFAIETFGDADKPVLIGGVLVTVALLVAIAGAWSVSRPRILPTAVLVLGAVAGAATVTDRAATAGATLRLVPVVVLVATGLGAALWMLARLRSGETGRAGADQAAPAPGRRGFLLAALAVGGLAAAGGLVARAYGGLAATASRAGITLPGAARPAAPPAAGVSLDVDGITPYLTDNGDFYRVDTALRVPDVPVDTWRLRIHGLVDRELELTYDDLLARDLVESRITLTCVSNPVGGEYVGNATWLGVPIRELLEEAGVAADADAVKSTSADDWTAGTPLAHLLDAEHEALLAVGMNGEPLPLEHGFPVRMVVPGLYGYVSATKWLVDLEVTRFADFEAYWTTRGYAAEAPIKTSSRIDVPRSFARVQAGRVPVAGVAWSQTRGVEQVEVRVDRGAWQVATLAEEDNLDTWRQWVWEWDATPGTHQLEVRATDGTGYTQTSRRAPIAPDGSTGWNSVSVTVV